MARRQILTASFWSRLMAPPLGDREVAMYCTLTPDEIEAVARKRTAAARLGYAVSLAYLRHPGRVREVAPELNPMENVWAYLRSDKLAITVFDSYEDILDKCEAAWHFFANDPKRITSITHRDWITVN